jgi:hypothetical protein
MNTTAHRKNSIGRRGPVIVSIVWLAAGALAVGPVRAEAPQLKVYFAADFSDAWDAAALDEVKRAAPFDPLPKSYPRPTVEVHFHFEWSS